MSEEQAENIPSTKHQDRWWNILTLFTLLLVLAVAVVMLVIYNDPETGLNPFPPPDPPEALVLSADIPTATIPPTQLPTPSPTETVTRVPTVVPSLIPSATANVMLVPGTPSVEQALQPTPEENNSGRYPFGLQASPQGLSAALYDPSRGCDWMGVAGRVFDLQNRPVKGIRVALTGYLGMNRVELLSLSGTALQYGPSGYEFTLANAPTASTGRLSIQLFDQSDLPLSPKIVFDTYAECESNLILIDFKQVDE